MSYVPKYKPGSRDVVLFGEYSLLTAYNNLRVGDLEQKSYFRGDVEGLYGISSGSAVLDVFVSPYSDFALSLTQGSTTLHIYDSEAWSRGSLRNFPSIAFGSQTASATDKRKARLAYPGTGTELLINFNGSDVLLYDFSEEIFSTLPAQGVQVNDVAWSGGKNVIALALHNPPYAALYSYPDMQPIALPAAETSARHRAAVSPDGRFVVFTAYYSSSSLGSISVLDLQLGTRTQIGQQYLGEVVFVSDTRFIVARAGTSIPGQICFDYNSGSNTWDQATLPFSSVARPVGDMKISSCKRYFLLSHNNGANIYRLSDWTLVWEASIGGTCYGADIGTLGHRISNMDGQPVRDSANNPMPGVSVRRYHRESGMLLDSTTTDAAGYYLLPCGGIQENQVVFVGQNQNEGSAIVDRVFPA